MQFRAVFAQTVFVLFVELVELSRGSPHHDDLLHPHIRMHEFHEHHIWRLKGLIFGLFGISSIIVVGYLLYQYIIQELRTRRNHGGAAFTERGSLLPITEYGQQPAYFSRPLFVPLRSLRDYMGSVWGTTVPPTPIPGSTLYRPKYANDPWESM